MNVIRCRSCGAPMFFARTAAGKLLPIDAVPVDDGNVEILDDGSALVHGSPTLFGGVRYVSHFVTCPDGKEWSGR